MDALFDSATELPPSFVGHPLLYLTTTFSLLLGNLLALEWTWRLLWQMVEHQKPIKWPSTSARVALILLLVGGLIRSGPDMILLVAWADLSPSGRFQMALWDNWLDSVSFVPLSLAWLIFWLGGPMIIYQLERQPIPLHLWPTWDKLRRPVKIGVGVFVLCLAFTFLRPH